MPKLQIGTSLKINCLSGPRIINVETKPKESNIIQIFDGVFVGSYDEAVNKELLGNHGITSIINCSPVECHNIHEDKFNYLSLPISDKDTFEYMPFFNNAFQFITETLSNQGKVLIHCFKGISRAPTLVLAFLLYREKSSLKSALERLKCLYPKADPNLGFLIQLQQFEGSLSDFPLKI